ncbi:Di-copper centre-containing protein [Biscogniauxia sp. FL1348]|nr:Di-copper centre-containing protein [Biscogniauxia sp. FL1348]
MVGVTGKLAFLAVVTAVAARVVTQVKGIAVTGMTTGINQQTGETPTRVNINLLANDGGPMWDLYIRGLDALQHRVEDDPKSHFSVAGIHGMPYRPYNGVGPDPNGSGLGYCPHMETQFVAWHRAYVALYEQILGEQVQQLALEYTGDNASAYQDAAQKFRLPFWDWASDSTLPTACAEETVTVNGPQGQITMHNPLYNYQWQTYPLDPNEFPGSQGWGPTTTRDGPNGFDPEFVNAKLQDASGQIKDAVYRTFVSSNTFEEMASMANSGSSFEAPHNDIHNLVGGSFENLDITGFDSLFMLHHANLDRLAALWSAIHNSSYQAEAYATPGLYSTAKGAIITANSPLKPFYQQDGETFHTGMSASTTEAFGYSYAELSQSRVDAAGGLVSQVNQLYGGAPTMTARGWFAALQVERADLALPATIELRAGNGAGRLVGRTVLLGMPAAGLAHDEIGLGRAVDALGLGGEAAAPDAVFRALREGLRVEVKKGDGTTVNLGDVASLRLQIANEEVTPAGSDTEFPTFGARKYDPMVFSGIKGGWGFH